MIETHTMSNSELITAISTTNELCYRTKDHDAERYRQHLAHLKALQAAQAKRADQSIFDSVFGANT